MLKGTTHNLASESKFVPTRYALAYRLFITRNVLVVVYLFCDLKTLTNLTNYIVAFMTFCLKTEPTSDHPRENDCIEILFTIILSFIPIIWNKEIK